MRTGRKPEIQVNADYFSHIDSEEKAYWLGFVWADGHVATKAPWTVIIQIKDTEHVKRFARTIEYSGEVKSVHGSGYNPNAIHGRLVICRKRMCDDLNTLGRNNPKMTIPNISKELIRHFIRGYFDGDGSVYYRNTQTTNKYGKKYVYKNNTLEVEIIGAVSFLEEVKRELNEQGISTTYKDSHTEEMKYLRIVGGNNLRKLSRYMYYASTVALLRKSSRFDIL